MVLSNESKFLLKLMRKKFTIASIEDVDDIDWGKFLDLILINRIFPLAYVAIKDYLPSTHLHKFELVYIKHKSIINNLLGELERLEKRSKAERVRFVVVKGFSLSQSIYSDIYSRQFIDLDILVDEDDMIRMDYIVRSMNYIQPYDITNWEKHEFKLLPYPIMRLRHTNHYFEYFCFSAEAFTKIELHKRLYGISDEYIMNLLWGTETSVINTCTCNTLNKNYLFLFLCVNAFQNSEALYSVQGKTILRDYVDLYFFADKYFTILDWNQIIIIAKQLNILRNILIVIKNLKELYPEEILVEDLFAVLLSENMDTIESLWPWKMSFIDRMFNSEDRIEEIVKLQKNKIFNQISSYSISFEMEHSKVDVQNFNILENRYRLDVRFKITYNQECLFLKIFLPLTLCNDLEDFLFQFILYNSNHKNLTLYTLFEFVTEETKMVGRIINTPILRDSNVLRKKDRGYLQEIVTIKRKDGLIMVGEMPFSYLGIPYNEASGNLAVSFNMFKYMYTDTYHHSELDPQNLYNATPITFS